MDWSKLRSLPFLGSLLLTVLGLLAASGLVMPGSHVAHVVGWLITVLSALGVHAVRLSQPSAE